MLAIADSRFQPALLAEAQRAGKLPAAYRIPDAHRQNFPQALEAALAPHRAAGRFGALPFGTDLSAEELRLGQALRGLKSRSADPRPASSPSRAAMLKPLPRDAGSRALFTRMGLEQAARDEGAADASPRRGAATLDRLRSAARDRQQPGDEGLRLRAVAAAENVQVIEHVIEVVEVAARGGGGVDRPRGLVR